MANVAAVLPVKKTGKGKRKKGNKHATNTRRHDRKYGKTIKAPAASGKCGSSFCSSFTGCQPWK